MADLNAGDPAILATDVSPVIDEEAFGGIQARSDERALLDRFEGVATRDEAPFVLGRIQQELQKGAFIGPKRQRP